MAQQIEVTLPDSCSAADAQLAIDRHTVAQLEDAAMTAARVQPATALPWEVNEEDGRVESRGSILFYIAGSLTNKRICADAEYAVHAANNYPKLIEALSHILWVKDCGIDGKNEHGEWVNFSADERDQMYTIAQTMLRELGEQP